MCRKEHWLVFAPNLLVTLNNAFSDTSFDLITRSFNLVHLSLFLHKKKKKNKQ